MSYGLYQVEEEFRGSTLKVVRVVAFNPEAAIKSFAKLQNYEDPQKFNHWDDGTTRTITSAKTLVICRQIREFVQ